MAATTSSSAAITVEHSITQPRATVTEPTALWYLVIAVFEAVKHYRANQG
jgi:hypothetical protein